MKNAPWIVPNKLLQRDLRIPNVRQEIAHHTKFYNERIKQHPNTLVRIRSKRKNTVRLNPITVIKTTV